ncbi:MAG: hypothetical protein AAGI69_08875 [Cyanobacteria bacterium P01_H01_bin.21]
MNRVSSESAQNPESATAEAVVNVLNQLPLDTQRQVLDFAAFLLHRHRSEDGVQPDPAETSTPWEASTDEDWLALEAQLALQKPE